MGGGAGNATRCTAAELARHGHTVHVLTARLPAQAAVETVDSVTICRVLSLRRSLHDCGLLGAVSYLVSAFFALMRMSRTYDYDVYHFYFGLPTALLAPYVRFVLGKPYIIALRGSDVPNYDNTRWLMRPLHALLRPISRFLWKHASSVTVLSEDLKRLASQTAPAVESLVIRNGIDSDKFPEKLATQSAKALRLICVCRLVPRKGLEYLIAAMEELKNDGVTLEIVGSGQERGRVAELVRRRGVRDHILLSGYVSSEQLHVNYHQADVFVLPSLSESFGQVLLEAMSCGLPIVASSVGGIPETIRHGRNGLLVPPRNPAAIVASVRWMAANPKLRLRMGRFNAEQVRERYGWHAVAAQYESLYYRAVEKTAFRASALDGRYV